MKFNQYRIINTVNRIKHEHNQFKVVPWQNQIANNEAIQKYPVLSQNELLERQQDQMNKERRKYWLGTYVLQRMP